MIAQFEDGDDVGMLQAAGGLGFTEEALEQVWVVGKPACHHHLDGNPAVEERIGGFVDDTHPAVTDDTGHVVLADLCWFFRGHTGAAIMKATRTRSSSILLVKL